MTHNTSFIRRHSQTVRTGALAAIILLSVILASCSRQEQPAPSAKHAADSVTAAAQDFYTCTMHPYVHADKPGLCPVCAMPLVKKSVASGTDAALESTVEAVRFSAAQRAMANVQTEHVQRSSLSMPLHAVGVLEVAEASRAVISSRYRGRIEKLYASCCGQRVRKGEPLMDIYSPELVSAAREYLVADETRATSEEAQHMADASRSRLKLQYGMTDGQIDELEKTRVAPTVLTVYAPIGGTLIRKDVVEGVYVNEGTSLMEIADLSSLWAWIEVYESDLPRVHVGQSVSLQTDALPGKSIAGEVAFIEQVVNPATRTVRVRVNLANDAGLLKPQMYVRATINAGVQSALSVPRSAVMRTGTRNIVWVETEANVFEPRDVQVGSAAGERVQILGGLSEGDVVASAGAFLIDSESQLTHPAGSTH